MRDPIGPARLIFAPPRATAQRSGKQVTGAAEREAWQLPDTGAIGGSAGRYDPPILGGQSVAAVLVAIGALVLGIVLLTADVWGPPWLEAPTAAPKPPVRRVTRIVGLAMVAAGVAFTFLPVSTDVNFGSGGQDFFGSPILHNAQCGSVWQAMFTTEFYNVASFDDVYACGRGAFPHLWIACAVAAVGLVVAFWGASRGRLVRLVGVAVLGTGLIGVVGGIFGFLMMAAGTMGGE